MTHRHRGNISTDPLEGADNDHQPQPSQPRRTESQQRREDQKYQLAVPEKQPQQEESEEEAQEPRREGDLVESIFSRDQPSDVFRGLAQGAGSVAKGVALGAVTLVAAPVAGGVQEGVSGFFKGAAAGLASAVALPVLGLVDGTKKVYQGGVNMTKQKPKDDNLIWDGKTATWVPKYKPLDEVYAERQVAMSAKKAKDEKRRKKGEPSAKQRTADTSGRDVKDSEYYDVLGVPVDATQGQIRKAYYKLAMDNHPDKHPDDPESQARFQKIGEAYQVIGDETRRTEYDKNGKAATEGMDFIDSSLFFGMLFGSEAFEPYVGKFRLAMMAEDEDADVGRFMEGDANQEFREVQLAVQLRDRLEPYVRARLENNAAAVESSFADMKKVAANLCSQSFGPDLVDAVGFVYRNYAEYFVDKKKNKFFGGAGANISMRKRQLEIICSALGHVHAVSKYQKKAKLRDAEDGGEAGGGGAGGAETEIDPKDAEKTLEGVLGVMLQLCIHDLLTTVRAAAQLCLHDQSVNEQSRQLRAEGLQHLGQRFEQAARDAKVTAAPLDVQEAFQNAYIRAVQKKDQQEHSIDPTSSSHSRIR